MMKYKFKTLTKEQEDHVLKIMNNSDDFAIQAPPGSGKTFLLLALARKMRGYGLSVSFNKALAVEASKKFIKSVDCRTGHSLAFGSVGYKYKKRLRKLSGKHLADCEDIGPWEMYNSPANKGYLILNTIRKFCYSADKKIEFKHLPKLTILNDGQYDLMREDLVHYAQIIMDKMFDLNSDLPITHDVYLKAWALTNPVISKDFIFFDEYQDANPVIAQVIKNQQCQKIFVGDRFQQIYAWRGAVNALSDNSLEMLHITKSFRFGEAIAAMANEIISAYYPYKFKYINFHGNDDIESEIIYSETIPDCIICRTNRGVIGQTIEMLDQDQNVYILGGTKPLTYLINSIVQLKNESYTNHPELFLFNNYEDLVDYADSPMGGDLKPVLKLLEDYGRNRLLNILESTTEDPEEAAVTITTAHKAKGLEWSTVRLANDFKYPKDTDVPTTEEANILYVAASRALHELDLSQCKACSAKNFALARKLNYDKYILSDTTKDLNNELYENIKKEVSLLEKDYSID